MRAQPLRKNQRNQLVELVDDHEVGDVCQASGLTENALVRAIAGLPLLPRTRRRVRETLACFAAGAAEDDDADEADDDDDEADDDEDEAADDDDEAADDDEADDNDEADDDDEAADE